MKRALQGIIWHWFRDLPNTLHKAAAINKISSFVNIFGTFSLLPKLILSNKLFFIFAYHTPPYVHKHHSTATIFSTYLSDSDINISPDFSICSLNDAFHVLFCTLVTPSKCFFHCWDHESLYKDPFLSVFPSCSFFPVSTDSIFCFEGRAGEEKTFTLVPRIFFFYFRLFKLGSLS